MRLASPMLRRAPAAAAVAMAATVLLAAPPLWAIGEVVTDLRVHNNVRTQEETVRSIAGVNIGDVMESDTLERARERLHTSGMFADVNVYWEPFRDGVRVNIAIKEKFPWAPVPTFSLSPGNISGGLVIAHGNLFGRGKRGLIGGRLSTVDSGAVLVYDDPALFGSWLFYQLRGRFQDMIIPEFSNRADLPVIALRESKFRSWGGEFNIGVAWLRKVKTSVGWSLEKYNFMGSRIPPNTVGPPDLPEAAEGAIRGAFKGNLTFDFRGREHAIVYGNALGFGLEWAAPRFGSDDKINYWRAAASYEQGIRLFRRHNFIIRGGVQLGTGAPIWAENYVGGTNLRGFVYRQFTGDTQANAQAEYHFPLFSISKLDVRGLVFGDGAAIYWRDLPEPTLANDAYERRVDGRLFLPPEFLKEGLDFKRDIHVGVGAGIRFFLRSVAVPLVGIDFGHGIGTRTVRLVLVLGA
jgi:outer membrane protein insertion porin family